MLVTRDEAEVCRNACWGLVNVLLGGTAVQAALLVAAGVIPCFRDVLLRPIGHAHTAALDGLASVLCHGPAAYKRAMEEAAVPEALAALLARPGIFGDAKLKAENLLGQWSQEGAVGGGGCVGDGRGGGGEGPT